MKTAISVINKSRAPGLELGVRVSTFAFSQRLLLNWLLTFLCVELSNIRNWILHKKYDLSNVKFLQKNSFILSRDNPKTFICFEDTKNTGLLIFNSLRQKNLFFNFFVNRNWNKLTDSRKRAKILADNRKGHHPFDTLLSVEFSPKFYLFLRV